MKFINIKNGVFYVKPIEKVKIKAKTVFKCKCSTSKSIMVGVIKYIKASSIEEIKKNDC